MRRLFNRMDKILLFASLLMFGYGLFMIFDASSMRAHFEYDNDLYYFNKQLIILIVSIIASIFFIILPTKRYKKNVLPMCVIIIIMLLFLLISGERSNGVKSWINIGPVSVQPSEFAKIAIIMFSGVYYRANAKYLRSVIPCLIPLGIGAAFTILTLAQPDAGTAVIIFLVTMVLFYSSPATNKVKMQITIALLSLIVLGIAILPIFGKNVLNSMQLDRFNFLKPCSRYQEASGYQVCNGYIAINNGKLFSVSPGNSTQKYEYLPEAHTDFIFPIIVEEFGLISGIVVLLLYMLIIYRILYQAKRATNIGHGLMCYGVAWYIFLHVAINLVGVLGLLPLTGVPLPFLSYGGSFALTVAVSLSVVQRISIESHGEEARRALER